MLGAARQGAQALERGRSEEIRRLAEARLALLARAGGLLAESIDYPKTLAAVADLVVPRLADWASVEIMEADGSIRSVAVAHVDPEKVAIAQELRRQRPPDLSSPTGIGHVITTGRAEVVPEITEEMIAAIDDPEVETLVRELQLRSALIVPLSARGRTLGAMTLVWAESGRTYSSADLALAETLAARDRPRDRQRAAVPRSGPYRPHVATEPAPARAPHDRRRRPRRPVPAGRRGDRSRRRLLRRVRHRRRRVDGGVGGRGREGPGRRGADGDGAAHDPRGGDPRARPGQGAGHRELGGRPADRRGAVLHGGGRSPASSGRPGASSGSRWRGTRRR